MRLKAALGSASAVAGRVSNMHQSGFQFPQAMGVGVLKPYSGSVSGKSTAQELSDLVIYTEARKFKNFLHSRVKYTCNMMSSFPERKAMKLLQKFPREWVLLAENRLNRIYPHGTRFSSSNALPMPFWSCGIQMVALNFQTAGPAMQLNSAMFNRGGRTGYILKVCVVGKYCAGLMCTKIIGVIMHLCFVRHWFVYCVRVWLHKERVIPHARAM